MGTWGGVELTTMRALLPSKIFPDSGPLHIHVYFVRTQLHRIASHRISLSFSPSPSLFLPLPKCNYILTAIASGSPRFQSAPRSYLAEIHTMKDR